MSSSNRMAASGQEMPIYRPRDNQRKQPSLTAYNDCCYRGEASTLQFLPFFKWNPELMLQFWDIRGI